MSFNPGSARARTSRFRLTFCRMLSPDQIRTISAHTGMSRDDLIATLSEQLPELINQLTPDGRIPTEREASRFI